MKDTGALRMIRLFSTVSMQYESGRRILPFATYATLAVGLVGVYGPAYAAQIVDDDQYTLTWDNTLKYSDAMRVGHPTSQFINCGTSTTCVNGLGPTGNGAGSDGDKSFKQYSLISNRLDWRTAVNVDLKGDYQENNLGARVSAEGWYDTVYNTSHNALDSTTQNTLASPTSFTGVTRELMGKDVMLDDLFIHGRAFLGDDHPLDLRVGRHVVIWGESVFMATNSIAYAMAPINIIRAASVPQTEAKELYLPVNQISGQLKLARGLNFQFYYQLENRPEMFMPPGSYFSTIDFGPTYGAQKFLLNVGGNTLLPFTHTNDMMGNNYHGNYGVSLKYSPPGGDWNFGAYYLNFTDRFGQTEFPGGTTFNWVYPRNIQAYAVSASTNFGPVNFATEWSVREGMPLLNNGATPVAGENFSNNPAYPLGNTLHGQFSAIYLTPPAPLWDTAPLVAEFGGHNLLKVTHNPYDPTLKSRIFDGTRSWTALGGDVVFTPTYYQVAPGLDVTVPISLGWNLEGRSPIERGFNNSGAEHGGNISIGLNGQYNIDWRAGLNYTHFLGSYANNAWADRDFVSFSIQRSF